VKTVTVEAFNDLWRWHVVVRAAAYCGKLLSVAACLGAAASFGLRRLCCVKFSALWLLLYGRYCFARCKFFLNDDGKVEVVVYSVLFSKC
jgi:hypothetical protein